MGAWLSSLSGSAGASGAASGASGGMASGAASGMAPTATSVGPSVTSAATNTAAAPAASGFINDYYKPYIAGGQQNFSDAVKNMGNNPQTYGYVGKKLEDFSKMAPPLPPTQMASMPGSQPRRQQPEDSFAQLMRLRRGR